MFNQHRRALVLAGADDRFLANFDYKVALVKLTYTLYYRSPDAKRLAVAVSVLEWFWTTVDQIKGEYRIVDQQTFDEVYSLVALSEYEE